MASLGVDGIWISPFFKSPMKDFGYDVSDYKDIDPSFGTLADFDALIAEAHLLNLKVMVDLVLSHTSDQHPWFQNSKQGPDADKSNWYVWADPKLDGNPPNNWLSMFGGSAWQWNGKRQQYYLHNFLTSQPDLNFHEPAVQDALLDVAKFWLDRGVDGFRLDTINFYFHDAQLRDNPGLPIAERNNSIAPSVNPYNHQDHLYDKNQPENLAFLERLRGLMDQYEGRAAVGEVGDAQRGLEILAEYTKGDNRVHMCYAFDFLSPDPLTPEKTARVLTEFDEKAPDGWPCWALSNHDVVRHATRLATSDDPAEQRLHAALLLSLRGSACIYQGEELGLREADVPFEKLQDPYGIEFWPEFKGRDGCRTPMAWTSSNQNAGFSNGETWLPVDPAHTRMSVETQEKDPASLLNFYRIFLKFRKSHPALTNGDISQFNTTNAVLTFHRGIDVFCAFNLSSDPQEIDLPKGATLLHDSGFTAHGTSIAPFGALFAKLNGNL